MQISYQEISDLLQFKMPSLIKSLLDIFVRQILTCTTFIFIGRIKFCPVESWCGLSYEWEIVILKSHFQGLRKTNFYWLFPARLPPPTSWTPLCAEQHIFRRLVRVQCFFQAIFAVQFWTSPRGALVKRISSNSLTFVNEPERLIDDLRSKSIFSLPNPHASQWISVIA